MRLFDRHLLSRLKCVFASVSLPPFLKLPFRKKTFSSTKFDLTHRLRRASPAAAMGVMGPGSRRPPSSSSALLPRLLAAALLLVTLAAAPGAGCTPRFRVRKQDEIRLSRELWIKFAIHWRRILVSKAFYFAQKRFDSKEFSFLKKGEV